MNFANPGELRKKAQDCLREAEHIEDIASRLRSGAKSTLGSSWTGQAAKSLDTAVEDQIADLKSAAEYLRRAAKALNDGAVEVDKAIEKEKQKIAAEKRAAEERSKQLAKEREQKGMH